MPVDKLDTLKDTLLEFFKKSIVEEVDHKRSGFLKNKLSATFSYLFYYSYLNIWPSFFKSFIKLIENDSETNDLKKIIIIDYYLRILLSIHTEIGDQLYLKDSKSVETSNNLKDLVRLNDMEGIVLNWKYIITFVGNSLANNENESLKIDILKNLLKTIGSWVSWIDINLVINNNFLDNFYQFFEIKLLRNDVITLFIEIISKKMPSEKKMELLTLMKINDIIISSIDNRLKYNDADTESNDDEEVQFYEHLSKLINAVGIEYLLIIEKPDSSVELKQLAFARLNELLPYVLRILPNDYDDISLQVFPFISNFLTILKKIGRHNDTSIINLADYAEFLSNLLAKVIIKMKYDEDDDGLADEDEDEDAQEFQEIRNKLKVFQDAISAINPDLFVSTITDFINSTLFNESTNKDWRSFELGLFELTNFSEILRNNSMKLPKSEINKSQPFLVFQKFLLDLITEKNYLMIKADHPLIQLTFLDLIIKHYHFFVAGNNKNLNENNVLTNNILEVINSKYGLFNEHSKVQKRCFYLFSRFIKLTKPVLEPSILSNLIGALSQSLLAVKAQVSPENKTALQQDSGFDEDDKELTEDSYFESQLYLFETIGLLIALCANKGRGASGGLDESIANMIDIILSPLFNDLKQCMDLFPSVQFPLDKQQVILQAHHCLTAIGTFARGFEYNNPNSNVNVAAEHVQNKTVVSKFENASEVVLVILENFKQFKTIRDSARFAFSRFIPILQSSTKGYLTRLISIVLSNEDISSAELTNFVGFINQIVYSFSKDVGIYQLLNELLESLLDRIFKVMDKLKLKIEQKSNNEILKSDPLLNGLKNQKINVQKTYLTFIVTLVNNHVFSLLVNERNQKLFPLVVATIFEYINDIEETMVCKLSFNILENIISLLHTGTLVDKDDVIHSIQPNIVLKIDGIEEYLLKTSVSACFEIPFKNVNFSPKDAQSRLILNEISFVLKLLYNSYNDVLINFLQNVYFVEINFPSEISNDFLSSLVNFNDKDFKQYFAQFVTKLSNK